jgi:hypothetical protein
MRRTCLAVTLLVTTIACTTPVPTVPILEQKEVTLNGRKSLALSVRDPVDEATAQQVVDAYRGNYALVRVFTYREAADVGKVNPVARYTWTRAGGLARDY